MKRIKFKTNLEHEYISNFKCLQQSFTKMNVDKVSEAGKVAVCLVTVRRLLVSVSCSTSPRVSCFLHVLNIFCTSLADHPHPHDLILT